MVRVLKAHKFGSISVLIFFCVGSSSIQFSTKHMIWWVLVQFLRLRFGLVPISILTLSDPRGTNPAMAPFHGVRGAGP